MQDRIVSRKATGDVCEVHTIARGVNAFDYGKQLAEKDVAARNAVATYSIELGKYPKEVLYVAVTTPSRWTELKARYA